jgi:bacteriocin biosynthesis cyclodehydratase domain-containing protein
MLKPALTRLWRDPATVQLGLNPQRAVVLHGTDLHDLELLDLLDGTRSADAVSSDAQRRGHDPLVVEQVLSTLHTAGVIDDGPPPRVPARLEPDLLSLSLLHPTAGAARRIVQLRAAAAVAVLGAGRLGAAVAGLLAAAGIGEVRVTDDAVLREADLSPAGVRCADRAGSMTRGAAAAALVQPAAPRGGDDPAPGILVMASVAPVTPPEWLATASDTPHLPVLVRETTALIGPLVVPGSTPCLRCLELARSDRDPGWPALTAQLLGMPRRTDPCDITLATLAASLAAMQVLAWVDDDTPAALGAVLEFDLGDMRLRRRRIQPHPACGCGATG